MPLLRICNKTVNFQNTCTLLGVTFDSHLTWSYHIQNICNRAKSALNLMRCICGQRWGTNKRTLLLVYRALIRSLLDYGCIAFYSASDSNLKLLDALQYKALLLITGALRGTPLSSLLAECGEKNLKARRNEMILQYLIKLDASYDNPAKDILLDINYPHLTNKLKSKYLPIIKEFYQINNLSIDWSKLRVPCSTAIVSADLS